jgi:hypothetical protein
MTDIVGIDINPMLRDLFQWDQWRDMIEEVI